MASIKIQKCALVCRFVHMRIGASWPSLPIQPLVIQTQRACWWDSPSHLLKQTQLHGPHLTCWVWYGVKFMFLDWHHAYLLLRKYQLEWQQWFVVMSSNKSCSWKKNVVNMPTLLVFKNVCRQPIVYLQLH